MNDDSTEREYLLKSKNLTWEYVEVFEDYFGPVTLNDRDMKDEKAQAFPPQTGAKNKSEIPDVSYLSKPETFSDIEPSRSINENVSWGTPAYIRPSAVFSEHVVRSNEDVVEQNVDSDVRKEIYSQTLVPPQSVCKSIVKHDSSAPYQCSICNKPFPDKSNFAAYFRSHTHEKPFSCPQCGKTFSLKGNLKKHLLIHSGTKEHSCDICYKTFTQKGTLKRHLLVHSGTKQYHCDVCYKTFARKESLTAHRHVHTGDMPYDNHNSSASPYCSICYKPFVSKSALTVHLRTHTGEKPFSCPQCEKAFARKGTLKRHLLIHSSTKS